MTAGRSDPAPGGQGQPSPFGRAYFERFYDAELGAYERSEPWLAYFGRLAEHIVQDFHPRTVLDAGCAMGLLVEALRDRGVEARGVDISEYAVSRARPDVRPHLSVASILEPLAGRFDLITCIETLEHLAPADAARAIENIAAHTDDVLFSSTPGHFKEATHVNVQPVEHWAELFAKQGLLRDFDTDPTTYLNRWAVRFRRSGEPIHRLVAGYERRLWRAADEALQLRDLAVENRGELLRLSPLEAELAAIKDSRAYRVTTGLRSAVRRFAPRKPS